MATGNEDPSDVLRLQRLALDRALSSQMDAPQSTSSCASNSCNGMHCPATTSEEA